MRLPRRTLLALSPLVLAVPIALAVAPASPSAAIVKPGAFYQMYGTSCDNSPCGMRLTITSNPNNAAVRAEVDCANGTTKVGGWHTAVGETSATGECGNSTHADIGWEVWNMTQHYLAGCYIRPDPWSGGC